MKIDILSMDGLDRALEGWRLSRHCDAAASWEEVFTLDLPVCELPSAVLNLTGFTILEREIFTTPRNHVAWARTSHVDDPLQSHIPIPLVSLDANARSFAAMAEEKAAGKSQDEWRRHLPVTSETAWTTRMSFRDLLKITNYFYSLSHSDVIVNQLASRFLKAADELTRVVSHFTGSPELTHRALRASPSVKFLHEKPLLNSCPMTSTPGFHVIRLAIPLWLRAQIVRHRPLSFIDTFYIDVLTRRDVLDLTIEAPVVMEVASTRDFWKTILSKRTCWLAQDSLSGGRRDPWQIIVDSFGFDPDMLPCSGGTCPYFADASLRVTGADPGVPCPRYCNIEKIDKAPFLDEMIVAAESRHPHWLEEIRK